VAWVLLSPLGVPTFGRFQTQLQAILKYQEETGISRGGENLMRAVSNFLQAAHYSLSGMHKRLP
jgi:hypothetical protein